MGDFFEGFLSSKFFMPHGHCYLWKPTLVWLQVLTNSFIGLAYLAITITLVALVRGVRNIPFQWMYLAFGAFIVACGVTHFFDVVVIWTPVYWLDGAVRAVTAVASVGTALWLPSVLPKVKDLAAEAALAQERGIRLERANVELEKARDDLEARVRDRTADLVKTTADLATTLHSIGDAVIATDKDGEITRMNPVAEKVTGWSLLEARGRRLVDVFQGPKEEGRADSESPVARVARQAMDVAVADEMILVARDGTERPVAVMAAPIRDAEAKVSGMVLVFRDRTEERRMEAMRIKSIELEAQNQRIQEASRLKSELLANMSHELRTPLNAIIGFADLIFSGRVNPDMPEHQDFVEEILTNGRHLLRLINDILDLSKIESGTLRFFFEPVNVAALIDEVRSSMRTTIAAKAVHVDCHVDPDLGDVVLDPSRFRQILYNYLSNALKFTNDGGRVEVRVVADPQSGGVRLEVTDNGIGIAPEDIGRLFVDFQQLDAGVAKKHAGTGLGLALTKRLVEAQGGTVGVRSTPGVGSTFHVVLPRRPRVEPSTNGSGKFAT